jgi:hypothetical protein
MTAAASVVPSFLLMMPESQPIQIDSVNNGEPRRF